MNNKKGFDKLEIWVVSGAIVTLIVTIVLVVISISAVSSELYSAFSPSQSQTSAHNVEYNLNGYNALGLQ